MTLPKITSAWDAQKQWEPKLNKLGWYAAVPDFWERLRTHPPQVAILAPPLDTVPSVQGNAIYVLIERLAELLPFPCLILARQFKEKPPDLCAISDRILYYRGSMEPATWETLMPYRVKKKLFGTGEPLSTGYGSTAGKILQMLDISLVVVEDVPNLCPLVKKAHSGNVHVILHQHIDSPVSFPRHRWNYVQRSMDSLVFVSQSTKETTEQKHGKMRCPCKVIYNGVNLAHYDPQRWNAEGEQLRTQLGIPPNEMVLLFVGRLIPGKGALNAAKALVQANIAAHLVVVGDFQVIHNANPEYLAELRSFAEEHSRSIHLMGVIQQDKLPAFYALSDAVIVPSIGHEGLPKVVTESLAMETPVFASDRGGTWELLRQGKNGWKIDDPSNIEALATLLHSTSISRQHLKNFREAIRHNDRPHMDEQRMTAEFASLIKSHLQ